jgi:hypothetical protein
VLDAKSVFTAFLAAHVTPFLADRGFHRSGQVYRALRGRNQVLIHFQRRGDFFTCDLGVANAVIRAAGFVDPEQFRTRLGPIAVRYDKWWDIQQDLTTLGADFLAALALGLDYIEPLATDEGLRAQLLADAALDRLLPFEAGWLLALEKARQQ